MILEEGWLVKGTGVVGQGYRGGWSRIQRWLVKGTEVVGQGYIYMDT